MQQPQATAPGTALRGADAQSRGVDAFWLKLIAILGMTLDHIGIVFREWLPLPAECVLYAFGGLTFPIMAFLLCEGYRHTRDLRRYALRLLGFALVTQLPYMWALMPQLNVLFTLLLGLIAILVCERVGSRLLRFLAVLGLVALSFLCDWGMMGVPMVLLYFYVKNRALRVVLPVLVPLGMLGMGTIPAVLAGYTEALPQLLYVVVGCGLTIPLLLAYNGRRGRPMQYFFYAYYPLHLAVLGLLRGLIMGDWGSLF